MTLQMKQQKEFKKMDMQVKKEDLRQKRIDKKQQMKQQNKKVNGRPGGSKGITQKKKRVTKPKGMAFFEYENNKSSAANLYNAVEEIITNCVLTSTGKKYKKALAQQDRNGIEELAFAVASYMALDEEVTLDSVKELMSQEALVINPVVAELEEAMLTNYTVPLTAEQRRDVRAQAIALSFMEIEEDDTSE